VERQIPQFINDQHLRSWMAAYTPIQPSFAIRPAEIDDQVCAAMKYGGSQTGSRPRRRTSDAFCRHRAVTRNTTCEPHARSPTQLADWQSSIDRRKSEVKLIGCCSQTAGALAGVALANSAFAARPIRSSAVRRELGVARSVLGRVGADMISR